MVRNPTQRISRRRSSQNTMAKQPNRTMKNNMTQVLAVGIVAGMALAGTAVAQSTEDLLQALVNKGVLTDAEAEAIRQKAIKKPDDQVPKLVENITIKGDLRLRYEQKHQSWEAQNILARQRQRYRLRFGAVADLKNNLQVGFRLASGSTDNPISSNQSLDDPGHRDTLAIDQAYVAWSGDSGLTLYGGKMPNHTQTGWMINKGLIDSDYTPEGIEAHYDFGNGYAAHFGWNSLYETSGSTDMDGLVMGQITGVLGDLQLGLGGIWIYNAEQIKTDTIGASGQKISHKDAGGNSESGNQILSNFNPWFIDAKYGFSAGGTPVTLSGTFINNPAAYSSEDTGYSLGVKYGQAKKQGTWEIGYEWRHLEKDVMWHQLTDSNFGTFGARDLSSAQGKSYYNGTNVEGSVIRAKYQIYDNTSIGLNWYITDAIDSGMSGTNEATHRIQLDLNFRF
jgi:hypothetical protein